MNKNKLCAFLMAVILTAQLFPWAYASESLETLSAEAQADSVDPAAVEDIAEENSEQTEPVHEEANPDDDLTDSSPADAPKDEQAEAEAEELNHDEAETDDEEPEILTGMDAFPETEIPELPFKDIDRNSPFYASVGTLYALDLISAGDTYRISAPTSLAEFVSLAVRLYEQYYGLKSDFTPAEGRYWYEPYFAKAIEYGLQPNASYEAKRPITRRQAVYILYRLFPQEELPTLRPAYRIPGLSPVEPQYGEIQRLYEAGILNGKDRYGTFLDEKIKRGESATMLCRMIRPQMRCTNQLVLKSGMDAFQPIEKDIVMPFTDIGPKAWYVNDIKTLYCLGFINGLGEKKFFPGATMTLAQATVLTVRIHEAYQGRYTPGEDLWKDNYVRWYDGYVELAKRYGLVDPAWANYDLPVKRDQFAYLIYHALPETGLVEKNTVKRIPDVNESSLYFKEIFALYRAGILTGNDKYGTFSPKDNVTRAEVCTMFKRLIQPENRVGIELKRDLRDLENKVRSVTSSYAGKWSVYLCDVESDSEFVINPGWMWSASLMKLYVMATVLQRIENGSLYNSTYIENEMYAMITYSSNTAWSNLYRVLGGGSVSAGREIVNQFCAANNYPSTGHLAPSAPYNTTSVMDTGLFLKRMMLGCNVSQDASNKMLQLMLRQQKRSKIPSGIPANIGVANKTGELYGYIPVENDAAVIFAPTGTYILVIMTQGGGILNIRSLSSMIYREMLR